MFTQIDRVGYHANDFLATVNPIVRMQKVVIVENLCHKDTIEVVVLKFAQFVDVPAIHFQSVNDKRVTLNGKWGGGNQQEEVQVELSHC